MKPSLPLAGLLLVGWLLAGLVLAGPAAAQAQQLHLEPDSLRLVQARAQAQHQLVLAIVAPPPPPASAPEAVRRARSRSGLQAPEVAQALAAASVLVKEVPFGSAEAGRLGQTYPISTYPTYLYFAPDGTLLYRRFGNSSSPAPYLQDLAAAQQELANPHRLGYYQAEYARGHREADFLRQYLAKRQQLGQVVEPALIDTYAEQLPAKAFDRGADVQFLLELGPTVGSRAFQLTHLNGRLIDSLYRALPLAQRTAINNRIIARTSSRAVATRDQNLAQQGANFARGTWTNNSARGQRSYDSNMLDFYRLTKDTTRFLGQAAWFYDRYYMSIPADSVQRALAAQQAQQEARQRPAPGNFAPGTILVATAVRPGTGPPPAFVNELNTGAWNVYLTGTRNRSYLTRALHWSKRTVDLYPQAAYYDTLAHLLYRLRFFAEAEAMQQQAVARAAPDHQDAGQYEQVLSKIQKRQPL